MNHGPLIFLGLFFTMAWSWYGFVFTPQAQMGGKAPETNAVTGEIYPNPRLGFARAGADVYRANGCVVCHTQQVRPKGGANDIEQGLGLRYTVAEDFLHDEIPALGNLRIGPDLSNVGLRRRDAAWQLRHLYNPKIEEPNSTMPPYPFLFEKQRAGRVPSPDALALTGKYAPPAGYEIVPTPAAVALVDYLLSLKTDKPLFAAPMPGPKTNAPAGSMGTNNPAAPAALQTVPAK